MAEPFHNSASELLALVAPALRLNPEAVATVARCLAATATMAVEASRMPRSPAPTAETPRACKDCETTLRSYEAAFDRVQNLEAALASERAAREQAERERDELQARVVDLERGYDVSRRALGLEPCEMLLEGAQRKIRAAEAERDALRAAKEEAEQRVRFYEECAKAPLMATVMRQRDAAEADLARTREAITKLADEWEAKANAPRRFSYPEAAAADGAERDTYERCAEALRALSPSDTTGDTGANHE